MICCTTRLDLQELVMNVKMCCDKCEDIVKERVLEVPGVVDVKTDRVHSKVLVVGKVDKSKVLKKAKKVDKKADFVVLPETKKTEEKKKQEEKKDAAGSSTKAMTNVIYNPPPYPYYPPYYPPTFTSPVPDSPYTTTQPYSPYYNRESDYGYYSYPHNSHYFSHSHY
jgi:copper chaperone CopZ